MTSQRVWNWNATSLEMNLVKQNASVWSKLRQPIKCWPCDKATRSSAVLEMTGNDWKVNRHYFSTNKLGLNLRPLRCLYGGFTFHWVESGSQLPLTLMTGLCLRRAAQTWTFVKVCSMFSKWDFVFSPFGFVHNHVTRKKENISGVNFYSQWLKKNNDPYWPAACRLFFLSIPHGVFFWQNPERDGVIPQERRTTDENFDWMKVVKAPIQNKTIAENGMNFSLDQNCN